MKAIRAVIVVLLVQALLGAQALAHGSITAEGDLCVIRIGFYTAHFKIFQPDTSQEEEFCEDLPATGSSIFVMDYLHQALGKVPIDFRIIRDTTGLGRFARLADVNAITDLEAITVFHQEPVVEPRVFSVLHDFTEEGDFIGIVTVSHPDTEQLYSAVFPFHVGAKAWGYIPLFAALAVLSHLAYLFFSGTIGRWRTAGRGGRNIFHARSSPGYAGMLVLVPVLLLAGTSAKSSDDISWTSESGAIKLSFHSAVEPVPLNRIHEWTLHLETLDGAPVENATVAMNGGMPAHNHGLPTAPVVTGYLGDGNYRVEGIRFHMQGLWVMEVSITQNGKHDTVLVSLEL